MNHDNILAHLQMCFDCLAPKIIMLVIEIIEYASEFYKRYEKLPFG